MKRRTRFWAMFCFVVASLVLAGGVWASGLVVIVNPESGLEKLSRDEVVQYFMGRMKRMPNGAPVVTIDVQSLRSSFYQSLLGKDLAEVNAYWARLKFSGQTHPPMLLGNDASAIERVASNPDAIAYIRETQVDRRVRVVLKLEN